MPLGREVGLSPSDIVLGGDPAPPPQKDAEPPIFGPSLLWPNGWMDQDETWHGGRPRPWPHCVGWGPAPLPKRGWSPQFSAHVYCGHMAAWVKMPLGREVGLSQSDIVLPSSPPPKGGGAPQFLAHVYCGQTARWIKMALVSGTEVDLSSGHIMLNGDPAPPSTPTSFKVKGQDLQGQKTALLATCFYYVCIVVVFHIQKLLTFSIFVHYLRENCLLWFKCFSFSTKTGSIPCHV